MTRLLAAMLALAVVPPAAALSKPLRFSGRTAEKLPISFRVSGDGRHVDRLSLGYSARCDDDIGFAATGTHPAPPVPVARDGTFTVRIASSAIGRIDSVVVIRGRISGHRASGTLRVRLILGNNRPDCVTSGVPWSARA
jgi:hypothetical protein